MLGFFFGGWGHFVWVGIFLYVLGGMWSVFGCVEGSFYLIKYVSAHHLFITY